MEDKYFIGSIFYFNGEIYQVFNKDVFGLALMRLKDNRLFTNTSPSRHDIFLNDLDLLQILYGLDDLKNLSNDSDDSSNNT